MKKYITISILVLAGLFFVITTSKSGKKSRHGFAADSYIPISEPFTFKTDKAEQLSIKAFNLKKAKEYSEAIQLYRTAIKIEPDNPKLFFDLSDCYCRIDKLEEAISLLDTAIMLDSSYAPFYNNRGLFYGNLNNYQKAISDFKKAIKFDSGNYVIYANIAIAYYSDKDLSAACEALKTSKLLGLKSSELNDQDKLGEIDRLCK